MNNTYPSIKISYFNTAGRAEMCRLALTIGDVPFVDERFELSDWPAIKPETPYGQSPTLFVDGKQYAQANAMLRYCGKIVALYPTDPLLALQVDEVIDVFVDTSDCLFTVPTSDPDAFKKAREKFVNEDVPRYIGGLEKRLETFGNGLWAVGDQLSIADLCIYGGIGYFKNRTVDFVDSAIVDRFTRLNKIYESLLEHPKVVAWNKAHM